MDTERYRVRPGDKVRLSEWSTSDVETFNGAKSDGKEELERYNERLLDLQQMLYAEARHKVLVVLQGMDTAGKDGTIKHVFRTVNPLGVRAVNFRKPSTLELAHDYLWRVHQHTPSTGTIAIFNRSHYEDVLIVRVHGLVPTEQWEKRYAHICDFERMLADEGTTVIKFFLHISSDEQRDRLQERIDNPDKNWKFEHGDLSERLHWDAYQEAYEAVLNRTSTDAAPWYVVPSDRKWYRNLVVSRVLIRHLERLEMSYPDPPADLPDIQVE
ncbi:MAG: polyphosphate kinase 2 family protein [Acidimicrobiia bacterium]|nr:polyphosphate kinase 2 family protein [Acidimicrobiia bacterium]